jgi:hypothetical protein
LFEEAYAFCTLKSLPEVKTNVEEFKARHQGLLD